MCPSLKILNPYVNDSKVYLFRNLIMLLTTYCMLPHTVGVRYFKLHMPKLTNYLAFQIACSCWMSSCTSHICPKTKTHLLFLVLPETIFLHVARDHILSSNQGQCSVDCISIPLHFSRSSIPHLDCALISKLALLPQLSNLVFNPSHCYRS